MLVRDPAGQRTKRAFFTTDCSQAPTTLIQEFVRRWALEVTIEESRAHLGIETQRQWSDLAIQRTTPAIFGLFSLVVLMANALCDEHALPCAQTAWYPKPHATFHDLLGFVRSPLWWQHIFQTGALTPELREISPSLFDQLLSAVCH